MVAENNRILQLQEPKHYSESGATYTILIEKLYKRRFYNVSRIDVEHWMDEAQQQDDVILVETPLQGIAICREILESTAEDHLMHPVVASENPEIEGDKDVFGRNNYAITFAPVNCDHADCSLDFAEIEILKEPELLTIGKSRYDPDVAAATKKYRERRKKQKLNHLKLLRLAIQTMQLTQAITDMMTTTMTMMITTLKLELCIERA